MIACNNGLQIGNSLLRNLARVLAKKIIRNTEKSLTDYECLKSSIPSHEDWCFLKIFEEIKCSNRKQAGNKAEPRETKSRNFRGSEVNEVKNPPKVSEDCLVLRKTLDRQKRIYNNDDFSTKYLTNFAEEESWMVRAAPRPPTTPPPHPGCPSPPPPPDSSSGCGYCPPCPPRRNVFPPASPPGGRNPPKPKYPPCPDPENSKSKQKCPSNSSGKTVEKPVGPAKCPENNDRTKQCPPCLSNKDNPLFRAPSFFVKPSNRCYSCSKSGKREDSGCGTPKCSSKSSESEKPKIRNETNEKCNEPVDNGRVICIKPNRKRSSSEKSVGNKCGKKRPCSDGSKKTSCRSFSLKSSSVRFVSNRSDKGNELLSPKSLKPGPNCKDKRQDGDCKKTKAKSGKGYRSKRITSECKDIPETERTPNTGGGIKHPFNPCKKEKP